MLSCSLLVSSEIVLPDFRGLYVAQGTLNLCLKSGGSTAELGGEQFDFWVDFRVGRLCFCCRLWVSRVENTPTATTIVLQPRDQIDQVETQCPELLALMPFEFSSALSASYPTHPRRSLCSSHVKRRLWFEASPLSSVKSCFRWQPPVSGKLELPGWVLHPAPSELVRSSPCPARGSHIVSVTSQPFSVGRGGSVLLGCGVL